jgi:diguanylate cyclase (GGDEF)-like protein/PAS domain S-box-containing protein
MTAPRLGRRRPPDRRVEPEDSSGARAWRLARRRRDGAGRPAAAPAPDPNQYGEDVHRAGDATCPAPVGVFASAMAALTKPLAHSSGTPLNPALDRLDIQLLGSAPVSMMAIDINGTVVAMNAQAEAMYGWSAAEAVGRQLGDIAAHADRRVSAAVVWEQLLRGSSWEGEYRIRRRDGRELTLHTVISSLVGEDGTTRRFISLAVDVTEERQGAIAMLDAVIGNSPTSVTIIDADDRIALSAGDTRKGDERYPAYAGRKVTDLISDPDLPSMVARARGGEIDRRVMEFGGRSYDGTAVAVPHSVAGPGAVAFVATDITERVAAEKSLRALNRLHTVLTEAGRAIVRAEDPLRLVAEITRILVETGEFAAAVFTTAASPDGEVVVLAECHAPACERSPAAVTAAVIEAVRAAGRPSDVADEQTSGIALFALPRREGLPGMLALSSCQRGAPVTDDEHSLLSDLAREVAFGLDSLSIDRNRAEAVHVSARRAEQQSLVAKLGVMALDMAGIAELFETAVDSLAPFGVRQVILYEALAGGVEVLVRAAAGADVPVARGVVVQRSHLPVTDRVLLSGEPLTVDDFAADPRFGERGGVPLFSGGSAVSVPVRVKDDIVAALTVHCFAENAFDSNELHFYESIANVLSGAMERSRYEDNIRHDAMHDRLTGLPNRTLLNDRLTQALARCHREQSGSLAVLAVDIDGFKTINDIRGRAVGDRMLAAAGRRLRDAVRPSDTVAHLGGDEFVVLCEDLAEAGEAVSVARRITERMREAFVVEDQDVTITVSVGIALSSDDATVDSLLGDADAAMYRAKETGRDRYELVDDALRSRLLQRIELEQGLRQALERGEFALAYQPILDLASGDVREAEALLRWTREDGTVVSPAEFIPIAESTGMIVAIGAWVLFRACDDAVRWNARFGMEGCVGVSVNLSARQVADPELVATVVRALDTTGLAPHLLRLEITETALMEEGSGGTATLQALDDLGVRLSVDDFGTGYSSLMYLRRYPVRVLKIDQYFVAGLGKNAEDDAIVKAVIALAHSLGLSATAEGVETVEQLGRLRVLGCDSAQGFLWSRAVRFDEFIPLVRRLRVSAGPVLGVVPVAVSTASRAPRLRYGG